MCGRELDTSDRHLDGERGLRVPSPHGLPHIWKFDSVGELVDARADLLLATMRQELEQLGYETYRRLDCLQTAGR